MAEQTNPPLRGLIPHLTVRGGKAAAEFYKKAFGAEELQRLEADDGKRLLHCHLRINGADLMMCDEFPEHGGDLGEGPKGVTIHLAVEDADSWWQRALAAGASVTMPIGDQFWGDRYGRLLDPFGHSWSIGSPIKR